MKAALFTEIGRYPRLAEVDEPQAAGEQVRIRLRAAALNHRDLYIVRGLYPNIKVPCILGSDGVGDLDGKRVILLPGLNWGTSEEVQSAEYEVLGMPANGTFAEYCVVPEANVYACPEFLSDAEAAALPLAGLTAYRTLMTRARARSGDTVLVTGAGGGVATFVIQFAVALGCRVFVTSSSEEKISLAKSLGAVDGVNYTREGWEKELNTLSGGLDVVVDSAGGEGFSKLTKLMLPGGRMAFYGGTCGIIPQLSPQLLFWRQITIAGSTMGSPREFGQMLNFVENHQIHPVVDSIRPLEDLADALAKMEAGKQRGKLVLSI